MEGFSSIATPLTTLTKKKFKFAWAETCEKSFLDLKDKLTSAPVLTLPKCGENYTLYWDASMVSLGFILMHGVRLKLMRLDNSSFMNRIMPLMTSSWKLWCFN